MFEIATDQRTRDAYRNAHQLRSEALRDMFGALMRTRR